MTAQSAPAVSVLVFDGRRGVRNRLAAVVAAAPVVGRVVVVADAEELVSRYVVEPADVVLVGTQRALADGLEAVWHLRRAAPAARVVVLGAGDDRDVAAAAAVGAQAYLSWGAADTPVLGLLLAGVLPGMQDDLARELLAPPSWLPALTPRDRTLLAGFAAGLTDTEISEYLPGARSQAKALFKRMGAANRAHAVAIAIRVGVLS